MEQEKKNIISTFIIIIMIATFTIIVLTILNKNFLPKSYYKASDFSIKTIYSDYDYDNDNIDDYSEFVVGARKDAQKSKTYISKYYDNSYPPDNEGICTDVIWRAFKQAGYSLRDMIDENIKNNPEAYSHVKNRDKNIDFRKIINQKIFFERYAFKITTDTKEIKEWQPGDIVVFEDKHIGIISDHRNKSGVPFVIHNKGQTNREEDYLTKQEITGHYRFDAKKIDKSILKPWK